MTNMRDPFPCRGCLVLPICKKMDYMQIVGRCSLIRNYLYNQGFSEYIFRKKDFVRKIRKMDKLFLSQFERSLIK